MLCPILIHTSKCLFLFRQIVVLTYMGAELKDEWSFKDIGVLPGATIRIGEKEEKRPRLYVNCSFNNDRVREISILTLTLHYLQFFILVDEKHSRHGMKHIPTSKLLRSHRLFENVQENLDFDILIITPPIL